MAQLFSEFSIPSIDQWRELTKKELKGADIDQLQLWLESDGFQARPAYFRPETEKLPMYGQTIRPLRFNQQDNDWLICADVRLENVEQANADMLQELSLGATAITIDLNGHDLARDEFDILFDGVLVEAISVSFINAYNVLRFQADHTDWMQRRKMAHNQIKGGFWFEHINADLAAALIHENKYPSFGAVGLNAQQFYLKGANIWQQLGAAVAWANELVNGLRQRSVSFEQISNNLGFSMAVGTSFLPELVKFRLLRFLWARVMQQHGAAAKRWKVWVHAQTGERHLSSLDTPVNLLRENAMAMSAVFGGVDSLTINPFRTDEPELAQRMALNTQHIMKHEARLHQVIDPAAGSFYAEHLTDLLGAKAWQFFLQIEEQGGYEACVTNGFLEEEFARTDETYYKEVEELKRVLVGTNKYPSPFEESNDRTQQDDPSS